MKGCKTMPRKGSGTAKKGAFKKGGGVKSSSNVGKYTSGISGMMGKNSSGRQNKSGW